MKIYPAIDLMDGRCVRLYKGDFDQSKIYDEDPVSMAQSFQDQGATTLHLVDLDGAKNPENRQTKLIENIISSTGLSVQTGGGIRSIDDVSALLDTGVARVVIGSMAVKDKDQTVRIFKEYSGDKICLALDVMQDQGEFYVATSGWQDRSDTSLDTMLEFYQNHGLKHVLCTDIGQDGTLEGPNIDLYKSMAASRPDLLIQASGGVGDIDDLKNLKNIKGITAVIVGKAIYEGRFTVTEATAATC